MGVDIGKMVPHGFTNVVCTRRSTFILSVAHNGLSCRAGFSLVLSSVVGF